MTLKYEMLKRLVKAANIKRRWTGMTTEELLGEVWHGEDADADTVWMYISFLQAKLQSIQAHASIIGERGRAYQLKEI